MAAQAPALDLGRLYNLDAVNRDAFGNTGWRFSQLQVISRLLGGQDTVCVMPTGGGKSLCYQLPTCVTTGVTVVISPLASLMEDQVIHATRLEIPCAYLGGNQAYEDERTTLQLATAQPPGIKLLFLTPEKAMMNAAVKQCLQILHAQHRLDAIIIDECHLVSTWSSFRPEYAALGALREWLPRTPILALTATATPEVQADIVCLLRLRQPAILREPIARPNLRYEVHARPTGRAAGTKIAELLAAEFAPGNHLLPGVIYVLTQNETSSLARKLQAALRQQLQDNTIEVGYYHAGMEPAAKTQTHRDWLSGRSPVVVCTTAFGMGINKSDIRLVMHFGVPRSYTAYAQECGRAGRDGRESRCVLFFASGDVQRLVQLIEDDGAVNKEQQLRELRHMEAYCKNKETCRHNLLLQHFGDAVTRASCAGACDNCAPARAWAPAHGSHGDQPQQPAPGPAAAPGLLAQQGARAAAAMTNALRSYNQYLLRTTGEAVFSVRAVQHISAAHIATPQDAAQLQIPDWPGLKTAAWAGRIAWLAQQVAAHLGQGSSCSSGEGVIALDFSQAPAALI